MGAIKEQLMTDADLQFRIAELMYEQALLELRANKLERQLQELKQELMRNHPSQGGNW